MIPKKATIQLYETQLSKTLEIHEGLCAVCDTKQLTPDAKFESPKHQFEFPCGVIVKTLTRHLLEANHTSFRHQSIHLEDGRVLSRSLSHRNTDQHEASVAYLHILNM